MLTIAPGATARLHLRHHLPRHRLADQEGALQVDADHAVEIRLAQVEEIAAVHDAGIVDQNVDRRPRPARRCRRGSPRRPVADVATRRSAPRRARRAPRPRALPASSSMSAITTRAPSAAKRLAMARPMPFAPPVTMATLFSETSELLATLDHGVAASAGQRARGSSDGVGSRSDQHILGRAYKNRSTE